MSKKTITESLGLNDEVIDRVIKTLVESDCTIASESLELVGRELRKELLGDVDYKLSEYEKSLITVGFFMGSMNERGREDKAAELESVIEQLKETFPDFDELSAPTDGDVCDCPSCRLRRFEEKKGIKIVIEGR